MTDDLNSHGEEVEQELKLIVRGKARHLGDHALVRRMNSALGTSGLETVVTLASHRQVETAYWDTKRFLLACAGLACRVRLEGGQRSVTIKTQDSGIAADSLFRERSEFHAILPDDGEGIPGPDLFNESAIGSHLQEIVGNRKLRPIFTTCVDRRTFGLKSGDGSSLELMLDYGNLAAGSSRRQIHEMEFELRAGSPERLFQTAQALVSVFRLRWTTQSKFERGVRLAGGPAIERPLPELPVADPEASLDAAVAAIMRAGLARLTFALKKFECRTDTPETLHGFRVDLRRLQSIVDLIRPELEPGVFKTLRGAIKKMFRPTSPLREADMLLESWCAFVRESGQAVICKKDEIRKMLDRHRLACLGDLRRDLFRSRWNRSLLTLAAWVYAERKINRDITVGAYVGEQLDSIESAVANAARPEALVRAEDYHALRIQVKRLRILTALFVQAGGPGRLLDADTLRRLQDALGDFHDAQINRSLAESMLSRFSSTTGFLDWLDIRRDRLRTTCDNLLDTSIRTR